MAELGTPGAVSGGYGVQLTGWLFKARNSRFVRVLVNHILVYALKKKHREVLQSSTGSNCKWLIEDYILTKNKAKVICLRY